MRKVDMTTLMLVKAEALRLIDILDGFDIADDGTFKMDYMKTSDIAEFKQKARELRRDTIKLEKQLTKYYYRG